MTPSATGARPDDSVGSVDRVDVDRVEAAGDDASASEHTTAAAHDPVDEELLAPEEAYDDAAVMALDYPLVRLPHRGTVDRLAKETRWQEICEGISTHGALERPYLD